MFKVIVIKSDDEGFWIEDEKDFDTFWQALGFASSLDFPYEIYRDYYYISAVSLVARSTYDLWSR